MQISVEKIVEHGQEMVAIGREGGYFKALFDIEVWALTNDFYNEDLFKEIARLKASYKPITAPKEEVHGING